MAVSNEFSANLDAATSPVPARSNATFSPAVTIQEPQQIAAAALTPSQAFPVKVPATPENYDKFYGPKS